MKNLLIFLKRIGIYIKEQTLFLSIILMFDQKKKKKYYPNAETSNHIFIMGSYLYHVLYRRDLILLRMDL